MTMSICIKLTISQMGMSPPTSRGEGGALGVLVIASALDGRGWMCVGGGILISPANIANLLINNDIKNPKHNVRLWRGLL